MHLCMATRRFLAEGGLQDLPLPAMKLSLLALVLTELCKQAQIRHLPSESWWFVLDIHER